MGRKVGGEACNDATNTEPTRKRNNETSKRVTASRRLAYIREFRKRSENFAC